MNEYLKYILPNFILVFSMIYIWYKLLGKKINFKDPKIYISIIGLMIISVINYLVVNKFIRILLITVIFMFFFRFLFKESIQKCILIPIFYQLIVFISESIYAIVVVIIFSDDFAKLLNNILGLLITNFCVAILSILITSNKHVKKFYNYFLNITKKIKINQLIPFSLIILIILNIFNMSVYYKVKFEYLLIINTSFIITAITIIIYTLKTKNNLNNVSDKYNVAISTLNDYEDMMSKYRIANHENKNLLLTVRAMILNREKDVPKYIESIIEEKFEDDEKLMFKMSVIPSGGLRATIYSNIMKIKENKINYELDIDRKIKSFDFIELDTNTTIDICKIIGVFIDNAIDETLKLKNKYIIISLYIEDDNINIKISNFIKEKIEINKIYTQGYTTKTKGHGYGLTLLKNITDNNNLLVNNVEVNKKLFSQILIIKNKKTN